jgi:hypothetical protein
MAMTQKKMVVRFSGCGLAVAILLAAIRIYMLYQYPDVVYGDGPWFNTFTLILWPGAFYLTVMQAKAPVNVAAVVWSVAIFSNGLIYAFVGWIVWCVSRFLRPRP